MLVLSRKCGERIRIGDQIEVVVLEVRGNRVRLGISAPKSVSIHRDEIWRQLAENEDRSPGSPAPHTNETSDVVPPSASSAGRRLDGSKERRLQTRDALNTIAGNRTMYKILVVDDSSMERCLAGSLLAGQSDCEVQFAESGRSALEKMRESAPDVVVTDLVMPEMDGLELVRAARREFPNIPVILMTAYGSESLAVDALHEGASSYVPKAKRAERLVETVRRVLARTRANQQRDKLIQCVGKLDATFYLGNDPEMIPPLVDYVQQLAGGLELSDEAERIRAGVALEEALINAMCHGNLELTSEELDQSRTAGPDCLKDLIAQRGSQAPYRDRQIVLEVHVTNSTARFVVRDGGKGFRRPDTGRFTKKDCFENGNGSGFALMNMLMDEVAYNETGNEVTLIKLTN